MCLRKYISNKFLLGVSVVLIPIFTWGATYTVDFVMETKRRNFEIEMIGRDVEEVKSDVKSIYWHIITNNDK